MTILSFTISPESITRLADSLFCLSKFSESVSLEATADQLKLSTLNLSNSAYASFTFDAGAGAGNGGFFSKWRFFDGERDDQSAPEDHSSAAADTGGSLNSSFSSSFSSRRTAGKGKGGKFGCRIWNRSLSSAFRARGVDFSQKETAVERCEVSLQERPERTACRLLVKMICRHGVVKTYKLTYESINVVHAIFDKNKVPNSWSISSKLLREFIEYFGPKTEQLDISTENGKVTFTSFTEKIMDGKAVLKTPLHTSITVDSASFTNFNFPPNHHISINVRDFKSIVVHAETLHTIVTAHFSNPTRPMQLRYESETGGMRCEFTLMTADNGSDGGASNVTSERGAAAPRSLNARADGRNGSTTASCVAGSSAGRPGRGSGGGSGGSKQAPVNASGSTTSSSPATTTTTTFVATKPPAAADHSHPQPQHQIQSQSQSQSQSLFLLTTQSQSQSHQNQPPPPPPPPQRPPNNTAPPPPQSTLNPDSLFIPLADDDDNRWDEPDYANEDDDDEDDRLGWDASALGRDERRGGGVYDDDNDDDKDDDDNMLWFGRGSARRGGKRRRLQDAGSFGGSGESGAGVALAPGGGGGGGGAAADGRRGVVQATQRISQVRNLGLFDD